VHATALVLFLVNNVCMHEISIILSEVNVAPTFSKTYICCNINIEGTVYELMEFFLFSLLLEP
jgi:hypothetical protein